MSDPHFPPAAPPPTPPPAPSAYRMPGWIKAVLAASLALNLAVAGLATGAFVKNGGPPHKDSRDLGLGPLGDALTREDRRALRQEFLARFPEFKVGRAALQADFAALLAALRAEPFDAAALDASLLVIAERNGERLTTIRDILAGYLAGMPSDRRTAFADRLEASLGRVAEKDGKKGD